MQVGRDYEEQTPNGVGPSTAVTGGIGIGMPNFLPRPAYPHEQRYQILDNVTYFRGAHTLKVGTDINFIKEQLINLFQGGGVYSYTSLNSIATDCPQGAAGCTPVPSGALTGKHYSSFTQAFDVNNLGGAVNFNEWIYNFFVQDTWRATDRLLINLGLRYEYQQLPQPGSVVTNGVTFAGNPAVPETTAFNQDKKDWAPRLGLTYDLGAKHDTVVRAAYGIFYGLTSNSAVANALTNNGINQATYFFTPSTAGAPVYPNVLTSVPAGAVGTRPDINYFSPDLVRPRVHSVDVAIERHIGAGTTVSASYLYSKGLNLPFFRDINFNPANSTVNYVLDGQSMGSFPLYRGTRPNTNFGRIIVMEPAVTTHYNALVLEAKKRFSEGLLFNLNYTLAKAEDNGQTSATFFGGNAAVRFAHVQDQSRRQRVRAVQHRSAASLRRQLLLPAELSVGSRRRRRADAGERFAAHAENQRLAAGGGRSGLHRHQRHGREFRRALGRVQHRPPDRPQDVRPAGHRRTSVWAAPAASRCCGRCSTCSTWRTMRRSSIPPTTSSRRLPGITPPPTSRP